MLSDHQFRGSPVALIGPLICKRFPKSSFLNFYFWLHWVFVAPRRFSLAVERRATLLQYTGFPLQWILLLRSTGSRVCRLRLAGSTASAQ